MKGTFRREYASSGKNNPQSKGQPRYSYAVIGTPEELEDFKKSQGKFYVEDDGTPILNLTQDFGQSVELVKRRIDGRWVPAKGRMERAHDLAKKYPLFANAIAAKALENMNFGTAASQSTVSAPAVQDTADLSK